MTDLEQFVWDAPLFDTHEHLNSERAYLDSTPDVLCELFDHYVVSDLAVAGASSGALKRLWDRKDTDYAARFLGVRDAWEAIRHTGYGDAVARTASRVFALEEIVPEALEGAQKIAQNLHRPGERLRLLKDVANLSCVQIDDFSWERAPDPTDPGFFQYDLSAVVFATGRIDPRALESATGVAPDSLSALGDAIDALFEAQAKHCVAVKTQHAYERTLRWIERTDDEISPIWERRRTGLPITEPEQTALGDWALGRVVLAATRHELPIKIHTGTYAGHSRMPIERVSAEHLTDLLRRFPDARFVLMHASYPYTNELVAVAKHFKNVWVDLCWAWSIDPFSTKDFVRRVIHAVPSNKLFGFGGDSFWPNHAVSYSFQAREWIARTLQAEIDDRLLTEKQALRLAARFLGENQRDVFER